MIAISIINLNKKKPKTKKFHFVLSSVTIMTAVLTTTLPSFSTASSTAQSVTTTQSNVHLQPVSLNVLFFFQKISNLNANAIKGVQ